MTETKYAGNAVSETRNPQTGRVRKSIGAGRKLLFVDNDLGTFLWHRLALARTAQAIGFAVHVAAPDGPNAGVVAKHGFTFHPIPLTRRGVNPFREVQTILALNRLYRRIKPELIHHLRLKPVLYGTLAARLAGRPAVANSLTGLGYVFSAAGRNASVLRRITEIAMRVALRHRNATLLFENPDDQKVFINSRLVDEKRTALVAGSGVDIDFFRAGAPGSGKPLIILASRMLWDKGVGEFVAAARRLLAQGIQARFALVGDTDPGNPNTVPLDQLQSWRDEGAIEWWGWRPDIQAVIAESHVVCLPSFYGEGIPRILIEAASCGRPLIATDAPGCREIVQDGVNGFLVAARDPQSLADAMRKLLLDADLRARMGASGRELVLSRFSLEDVLDSNIEMYRELLSHADGVSPVRAVELINLLNAVSDNSARGDSK
jgi:glycosyltransferase involved in cell wall biosynthesis